MDLGLEGKVAIVTGGSKGIGLYTALQLLQEGAHVAICARSHHSVEQAASFIYEQTGHTVLGVVADVSKEADCQRLIAETVAAYGRLDILINNAGTSAAKSFENVTFEEWTTDLDSKLFGAIHCAQAALPHMKAGGGGAIVNLSAVLAKTPPASSLPTTVSRSAGLALTKAMSRDLGQHRIRVNSVCIGLIRSAQIEARWKVEMPDASWEQYSSAIGESIPLGRIGATEEAANAIIFLASDAASYITGTAINVDGGSGGTL